MDPKQREKLARFKEQMESGETESPANPLSSETLDYQEHMTERHKDAGHKINQAIVAEKQDASERPSQLNDNQSDQGRHQEASRVSWKEKHPELYQEMVDNNVPLDAEQFKKEGYRFSRAKDGTMSVLYPTKEYTEWLQGDQNPENYPPNHYETLAEKQFREEVGDVVEAELESIWKNRDKYYLREQKSRLQQKDITTQTDAEVIAKGFITDKMDEARLYGAELFIHKPSDRQIYSWFMASRKDPEQFKKIESAVARKISQTMQDEIFTPEKQHELKFQVLNDFIEKGSSFARNGWAENGVRVQSDSGKLSESRQISGPEFLEREGFIQSKQEWDELREIAERKCARRAQFQAVEKTIGRSRSRNRTMFDYRTDLAIDTSRCPNGYEKLFDIQVTPELLLKNSNSAREYIVKRTDKRYFRPDGEHERGWNGLEGNIYGIYKGRDWSDVWPQIKAARVYGFTEEISREIFLGCNVRGAKRRGEIKDLISSIIEESDSYEEELRREAFGEIFGNPSYIDGMKGHFFKPQTWLSRNRIASLEDEAGRERLAQSSAPAIKKILAQMRGQKSGKNGDVAFTINFNEAQDSLREYLALLEDSPKAVSILWDLGIEDRNDPLLQECLPESLREGLIELQTEEDQRVEQERQRREEVERQRQEEQARRAQEAEQRRLEAERQRQEEERKRIAEEKLRQEQEQLQKELERLQKIEDFPGEVEDGVGYHEQWVNGQLNTYVKFTNPSNSPEGFEMTDEKKEALREGSYLGLFNILLSDGRIGPGHEIRTKDREAAANKYFEVFNYGEHMDELNDWLTAKVEELHGNGEDDRAKLLKRRFSQWGKNEAVANAFQEYSDLVATRQHREEQDPRGDNLQVWHDTSVSDVLDKFDSVYRDRDDVYIGNRFRKAHGIGVRGEGEMSSESNFMPRDVARERINALRQWSDFIKENIPDADVEEALMVFDSKHDTLADAMNHLDGNTYSVISFNYAGKRCMIAECLGFNMSGASAGAMKIWMGELGDRRGWETAFNRSKTEAAIRGDCESINHTNIVDEVINRETDSDDYIVGSEDVMFKLAFRYFESDGTNKDILRNNATNRQQLADFIGPQMWRPNAEI